MNDFSDRLSPMIVKELRQGLRTRTFVLTFIALQAIMVIALYTSLSAQGSQETIGGIFWTILGFALLLFIPMQALQAINSESSAKTLDLLVLTRLQALRIVSGKWAAYLARALLLAVAVLPYIFLRYFLGGVNLLQELVLLVLLFIGAAVLTALTVCFSTGGGAIAKRGAGVFAGLVFFFFLTGALQFLMMMRFGGGGGPSFFSLDIEFLLYALPIALVYGAFLTYFFLQAAAGRIAPAASNHTTARRLLALALAAICTALVLADFWLQELWVTLGFITLGIATIDALTDRPTLVRSVFAPFHRRRLGPAAFLLAPGWHTGFLFSFLCLGLYALILRPLNTSWDKDEYLFALLLPSAIAVTPAALVAVWRPARLGPFRLYLIIHLIFTILAFVVGGIADNTDYFGYAVIGSILIPHCIPTLFAVETDAEIFAVALALWHLAVGYLVLYLRARPLLFTTAKHLRSYKEPPAQAEPETVS